MNGLIHESRWPDRFILMQYIGLKDSKGIEIYEGDIVKIDEAAWKGCVEFMRDRFGVTDKGGYSYYCDWEYFEIIGNIYENPELL